LIEWGTKIVGLSSPVKEGDELTAGKVYQADFSTPIDVPDALEAPLITELCKLKDKVVGSETTYVYVSGRTIVVQWEQKSASPVTAGAVIFGLMALAVVVLAIALALVSISKVEGVPAGTLLGGSTIVIILIVIFVLFVIPLLRR